MDEVTSARRQPRQDRARERVEGILDAAVEVLRSQGLGGLTMSAIAAQASMTLPSLYRYFADREAVLLALASRYFEALHVLLDEQLRGLRTATQAREAVVAALASYDTAFRADAALALLWGGAVTDPRLAELNAADSHRNGALLAERIGPFSAVDDDVLLRRCTLACHLTLATVSFALSMPHHKAQRYLDEFARWADALLFGSDLTPA